MLYSTGDSIEYLLITYKGKEGLTVSGWDSEQTLQGEWV